MHRTLHHKPVTSYVDLLERLQDIPPARFASGLRSRKPLFLLPGARDIYELHRRNVHRDARLRLDQRWLSGATSPYAGHCDVVKRDTTTYVAMLAYYRRIDCTLSPDTHAHMQAADYLQADRFIAGGPIAVLLDPAEPVIQEIERWMYWLPTNKDLSLTQLHFFHMTTTSWLG